MNNQFTISIKNNETGNVQSFETNSAIFAIQDKDSTDVAQAALARSTNGKMLIALLSGCINSFMLAVDDPASLDMIDVAKRAAVEKFVQQKVFGMDV